MVGGLLMVGFWSTVINRPTSSDEEECDLGADQVAAGVVTRYAPIAQLGNWDTDVLALRSRDSIDCGERRSYDLRIRDDKH
jgi:hypothetical protein